MGNQPVVNKAGILKKIYSHITFEHPEEHGGNECPKCNLEYYSRLIGCPIMDLFHIYPASKKYL
ncbi:MAG: hypothetical protein AMK70_15485 [Nitrospira bacterium SG8_35_1]|nr:MAG: hypothetical protein AMK70_15485 [Nitrospira bacterium SG8_35_1]